MTSIAVRGKRVPVGILVVLLVIPGFAAATGTTFQGGIEGPAVASVDQAIVISSVSQNGSSAGAALGTVSDDGSGFRFGASVHQGDRYAVDLSLANKATTSVTAQLRLAVPARLRVGVTAPGNNVSIARTSLAGWFLVMDPHTAGTGGTLTVTIAVPPTAVPGFYRIGVSVRPIEL